MKAYVRLNSMGASLSDVAAEYEILWIHAAVYFVLALAVYRYQIHLAKQDAHERLMEMKAKKGT